MQTLGVIGRVGLKISVAGRSMRPRSRKTTRGATARGHSRFEFLLWPVGWAGWFDRLGSSKTFDRPGSQRGTATVVVSREPAAAEWDCWFFARWGAGEVGRPTFRYS